MAVHWHKEFRAHELKHIFQIFLLAVASGMDIKHPVVIDLHPVPQQVIFQILDCAFVSGDYGRRENNRVSLFELQLLMPVGSQPHKHGIFFALPSGSENGYFVIGVAVAFRRCNYRPFFCFYVAEGF